MGKAKLTPREETAIAKVDQLRRSIVANESSYLTRGDTILKEMKARIGGDAIPTDFVKRQLAFYVEFLDRNKRYFQAHAWRWSENENIAPEKWREDMDAQLFWPMFRLNALQEIYGKEAVRLRVADSHSVARFRAKANDRFFSAENISGLKEDDGKKSLSTLTALNSPQFEMKTHWVEWHNNRNNLYNVGLYWLTADPQYMEICALSYDPTFPSRSFTGTGPNSFYHDAGGQYEQVERKKGACPVSLLPLCDGDSSYQLDWRVTKKCLVPMGITQSQVNDLTRLFQLDPKESAVLRDAADATKKLETMLLKARIDEDYKGSARQLAGVIMDAHGEFLQMMQRRAGQKVEVPGHVQSCLGCQWQEGQYKVSHVTEHMFWHVAKELEGELSSVAGERRLCTASASY